MLKLKTTWLLTLSLCLHSPENEHFWQTLKFLNITSPITFSQVSIYAGLAFPIHGAGTGLRLNALQVAGGALGSLAKLVPDGHTV